MGFKRPQAFSSSHYAGDCWSPNRSYGAASTGKRMSELARLVWQPLCKALRPLCDEESGVDTREGVIVHGERDFTDRGRP